MTKDRHVRLTWWEDFWDAHRGAQELVLVCPRDRRHTVGTLRATTPSEGRGELTLTVDDHMNRRPVGRLTADTKHGRLKWICAHCWAAGRRNDDNVLRLEPIFEVLKLMQRQGPPHDHVVLDKRTILEDDLPRIATTSRGKG